jgi:hypothetical protein
MFMFADGSIASPIVAGMVACEMSRSELKFNGAKVRDFVDYFERTDRSKVDITPVGKEMNNKSCSDTYEDRFGKGRCPRE